MWEMRLPKKLRNEIREINKISVMSYEELQEKIIDLLEENWELKEEIERLKGRE